MSLKGQLLFFVAQSGNKTQVGWTPKEMQKLSEANPRSNQK